MRIQAKDFMTTAVIAVEGTTTIGQVRATMQQEHIHALPIAYNTDGNVVVQGIVTSTDLCCKIDDTMPVQEAITLKKVFVVHPTASAKSAAEMMAKHHVHHLVVMENGKLVGMLSSLDFVKLVATHDLG